MDFDSTMETTDFLPDPSSEAQDALQSLDRLESRIRESANLIREAERKRAAAEEEAQRLLSLFHRKDDEIERLTHENEELRRERDEVRARIEALVERIDSLQRVTPQQG